MDHGVAEVNAFVTAHPFITVLILIVIYELGMVALKRRGK